MRPSLALAAISLLVPSVLGAPAHAYERALPTPISVATAKTYLAQLKVAEDSNVPAYNRDLFPHWDTSMISRRFAGPRTRADASSHTVSGQCNARESM